MNKYWTESLELSMRTYSIYLFANRTINENLFNLPICYWNYQWELIQFTYLLIELSIRTYSIYLFATRTISKKLFKLPIF